MYMFDRKRDVIIEYKNEKSLVGNYKKEKKNKLLTSISSSSSA